MGIYNELDEPALANGISTLENTTITVGGGTEANTPQAPKPLQVLEGYDVAKDAPIKGSKFEGNYSDEYLGQAREVSDTDIVYDPMAEYKSRTARAKKNKEATNEEKKKSFWDQAGQDNLAADFVGYLAEPSFKDEKLDMLDTRVFDLLNMYELDLKSYGAFKTAKSEAELDFRITQEVDNKKMQKNIQNALNDRQMVTASVAGMVDVDLLGGVLLGSPAILGKVASITRLNKSSNIMQLAAVEGSFEVGVSFARSRFSEEYHMSDALLDVGFGMGISIGLTKLFAKGKAAEGVPPIDDTNIPTVKFWSDKVDADGIPVKPSVIEQFIVDERGMVVPNPMYNNVDAKGSTFQAIADGKAKNARVKAEAERERVVQQEEIFGTPEQIAKVDEEIETRRKIYKASGKSKEWIDNKIKEEFKDKKPLSFMEQQKKNQSDEAKKQNEIQKKIDALDEEFRQTGKQTKEAKKYFDELQAERTRLAEERQLNRAIDEEEAKLYQEKVNQSKRETQITEDRRTQNEILADKFKNEKYKPFVENRNKFFSKQDKINADRRGIAVRELKVAIKGIADKLSVVRKELDKLKKSGGSKLKISNREKKVAKLQKEIEDLKAKKVKAEDTTNYTREDELYTMRVVDDMAENMVDHIDNVKKQLLDSTQEELEGIGQVVLEMFRREPETAKEIHDLLGSKLGNKIGKHFKLDMKSIKASKKLSKAQKTAVIAIATAGITTTANASEGSDDIASMVTVGLMIGLVALVGRQNIVDVFKNTVFKDLPSNIKTKIQKDYEKSVINTSEEMSIVRRWSSWLGDKALISLTSSVSPYIKMGGKPKEFVEKMFFTNNGGDALEILKQNWNKIDMTKYDVAEAKYFEEWLAENGKSYNILATDFKAMDEFRQLVSTNMRTINSTSKAIQNMTKDSDEIYKVIWDRAKEYGVKGFENLSYTAGKTPRLWDVDAMNKILNMADDQSIENMRQALITGALKANGGDLTKATKSIDGLLNHFKNAEHISDKRRGSLFEMLEDVLKDDVDLKKFSEATSTVADQSGRTRTRIPLDVDAIPSFEVTINGKTQTLNMSNMMENDSKRLLDKVMAEMNASSALAKGDFPTTASAREAVANMKINQSDKDDLNLMIDGFLGVTPDAMRTGTFGNIMRSLKDMTISEKLVFVMFSVPYEVLKTITNGGIAKSLSNIGRMISRSDLDNARLAQLMDMTGNGTGYTRADRHGFLGSTVEGVDGLGDAGGKLRRATHALATNAMLLNGLTSFTDWVQRANLLRNEDLLAEYVTKGSGLTRGRAESYGLNDDMMKQFKDDFKWNDNGSLKQVDTSKWSMQKKDDYGVLLNRIGQDQVLEHTQGSSPLWASRDVLGKTLSTLIGYPLMMHNVHFSKGMKLADRQMLMDNAFAFGGSYAGLQAKYSLLDKEVSDEQIAMYALMNTLPLSALGAITSMGDPAVFSVLKSALNLVNPVEIQKGL